MASPDPHDVGNLFSNSVFWMLIAWGTRELVGAYRAKSKEHDEYIERNLEQAHDLEKIMIKLEARIDHLEKACGPLTGAVQKIEKDLNVLHQRVRDLLRLKDAG